MISIAIKRTGPLDWTLSYLLRSLYTVNPILSPPPPGGGGAYLYQANLRRWGGGSLLETVSLFERGY